jgi:long-chain acyl-CoA synthetase
MQQEAIRYGIYQKLCFCNQKYARDVALIYFERTITYRGLLAQTERCARALLRWGIRAGDPVLLCSTPTPELIYSLLALWKLGAIPHLINPTHSKEGLQGCIQKSKARLLLLLDQLYPQLSPVLEEEEQLHTVVIPATQSMPFLYRRAASKGLLLPSIPFDSHRFLLWKEFLESGQSISAAAEADVTFEQVAAVVYPSQPKAAQGGVMLTHGGVCSMMDQYAQSFIFSQRQERFLNIIPPWQAAGLTATLLIPLCLGLSVQLEPSYQPSAFVAALFKRKPAHVVASGSFWVSAMKHPKLADEDLSYLCTAYTGLVGDSLSKEEEAALNVFLLSHKSQTKLQKAFSQCELGVVAICTKEGANPFGSVGRPLPAVELAICDKTPDHILEPLAVGEVWVSTPAVMAGYFQNTADTKAVFYEDASGHRWCRSGKRGFLSEEGNLYLVSDNPSPIQKAEEQAAEAVLEEQKEEAIVLQEKQEPQEAEDPQEPQEAEDPQEPQEAEDPQENKEPH